MSHQKELTDLESGPAASVAGAVSMEGPAASGSSAASTPSRSDDHVLDFNIANFSTPAGKQILHDVGACVRRSMCASGAAGLGWAGLGPSGPGGGDRRSVAPPWGRSGAPCLVY